MRAEPGHTRCCWEMMGSWLCGEDPESPRNAPSSCGLGSPSPSGWIQAEMTSEQCLDGAARQKKAPLMGHIPRNQPAELCHWEKGQGKAGGHFHHPTLG